MYRLLSVGEICNENDECFLMNGSGWEKVASWGRPVADYVEKIMPIRRKIEDIEIQNKSNNSAMVPCPKCMGEEFLFKPAAIYCWNCGETMYTRAQQHS